MTDLTALIEALEKASGPSRELDARIADATNWWPPEFKRKDFHGADRRWDDSVKALPCHLDCPRYTSSIDAARTLVPERLWWFLSVDKQESHVTVELDDTMRGNEVFGHAATPALALCIAALRAHP